MNAIGFTPESNKGSYTSGFSNTTITSGPGFSFATCAAAYSSNGTAILSGTTTAGEVASNGRAFTAQSQGIIIVDSTTVDIWQIDSTRNLVNTQSGL
jgi:hypothetical protein